MTSWGRRAIEQGQQLSTDQSDATSQQLPGDNAVPAAPEEAEGFFRPDGDLLVPASFSTSPWGPMLHGRLIGGLAARAAKQVIADAPGLVCSRLTVDMFRSAPLAPVSVTARPVRSGRRITVLDVMIEQADGPIGAARIVLLRASEQPAGTLRAAPVWDAPIPVKDKPPRAGNAQWTPAWQSWRISGADWSPADGVWVREIHPLVTDEPLTPLERLSMAADMVSPVSNFSDRGLAFINADYTIYLGREPQGEYIGIQPGGHVSDRGIAAGQCVLHDLQGPVGFVSTTALANPPLRPRPAPADPDGEG
jgi:Thioesterase-like superfamily